MPVRPRTSLSIQLAVGLAFSDIENDFILCSHANDRHWQQSHDRRCFQINAQMRRLTELVARASSSEALLCPTSGQTDSTRRNPQRERCFRRILCEFLPVSQHHGHDESDVSRARRNPSAIVLMHIKVGPFADMLVRKSTHREIVLHAANSTSEGDHRFVATHADRPGQCIDERDDREQRKQCVRL